jgi:SecD/SecF fusion protein
MNPISPLLLLFAQAAPKVAKAVPWYHQTTTLLLATLLALVASAFLGYYVSKRIRNSDYWWRVSLISFALLLSIIVIFGLWPPRFGVDLKGGTTFIAQVVKEGDETIELDQVITQLKSRIDPSGVYEIVLRPLGSDKIEIIIPDVDNEEAERIWKRVTKTGLLQFMIVSDSSFPKHRLAQKAAKEQAAKPLPNMRRDEVYDVSSPDKTEVMARWIALGRIESESNEVKQSTTYVPYKVTPDPSTALVRDQRTGAIVNLLAPDLRMTGSSAKDRGLELDRWAKKHGHEQLEVLMMTDDYRVEGQHLSSASMSFDSLGRPAVSFFMKPLGASLFGKLTGSNLPDTSSNPPIKKQLGIVLDKKLLSAPTINSRITSRGVIEGDFTQQEVEDLVAILKAGRLKAAIAPNPVAQDKSESSLGLEMRRRGLFAIGISFVAVLLFMAVYYRFAGLVACVVLIANLIFIVALIMLIKFPFSLTGLAGLVLTVGMSVDANVLIFERIREELEKGAALRMAIRNGFDRATVTIVDANVTTLITAVILYVIGTEQIKGFAVTLILGILMSMFTAIFCARVLFDFAEKQRWISTLSMSRIVGATRFDFIKMRTAFITASVIFIVIGLVGISLRGQTMLGHDLAGGTSARIVFKSPPANGATGVRDILKKVIEEDLNDETDHQVEVTPITSFDPNNTEEGFPSGTVFKIDTDLKLDESQPGAAQDTSESLLAKLITKAFPGQLLTRGLTYTDNQTAPPANSQKSDPANEKAGQTKADVDAKTLPNKADSDQEADSDKQATPAANNADDSKETTATDNPGDCSFQDEKDADKADNVDKAVDPNEAAKATENTKEAETKADNTKAVDTNDAETKADPVDESGAQSTETPTTGSQVVASQTVEITSKMNFNFKVGAEAVANLLRESASIKSLYTEIDPRDFTAEGFTGEDLTYTAKEWNVKFRANSLADGKAVMEAAKQSLEGKTYFQSLNGVGGSIATETQFQAISAVLASLIGIVLYIWVRFQKISFGLAAVVALVHDVLVVLGAIAVSSWFKMIPSIEEFKISLPVVAALMTVIGYSLNDTIVVFDRIREVRGKNPDLTKEMINTSIGQTLSRTLLTSLTTLIVVFILFLIGGDTIHGFAFALVVGIVVGTYSSIFIASPVLLWLMGNKSSKAKPVIAKPAIAKPAS